MMGVYNFYYRLQELAVLFGIDIYSYAVMSNPLHPVLRARPDLVQITSRQRGERAGARVAWLITAGITLVFAGSAWFAAKARTGPPRPGFASDWPSLPVDDEAGPLTRARSQMVGVYNQ